MSDAYRGRPWVLAIVTRCAMLVAAINFSGCDGLQSEKNPVTGGDYGPVTTEMLTGATFNGRTGRDRSFDDLQWTFQEDTFQITAGKNGLPPVLAESLLPEGVIASEISGQWTVANDVVTFTQIKADGKDVDQFPRTLKTMFTGVLRIVAGPQYKFTRRSAQQMNSADVSEPEPIR